MIHPIRRTGAAAPQRQPSELAAGWGLGGWQALSGWIARRRSGGAQAWRTWVGALVVLPLLLSVATTAILVLVCVWETATLPQLEAKANVHAGDA